MFRGESASPSPSALPPARALSLSPSQINKIFKNFLKIKKYIYELLCMH